MGKILPFPGNDNQSENPSPSFGRSDSSNPFGKELGVETHELDDLISGDPDRWQNCFTVQPTLSDEDSATIPVLVYARALLQSIYERQPLPATAKGNLPTSVVKELFQGAMSDAEWSFIKVAREDHSPVLQRTRRLTQDAGLLAFRSKKFSLTKAGAAILSGNDNSELYRRLLASAMRTPQRLEHHDRLPRGAVTVHTVPLLLHAVRGSSELYEEDLSELLYGVYGRSWGGEPVGEELDSIIRLRFFQRFGEFFGLFRQLPQFDHPLIEEDRIYYYYTRWEPTVVFGRAISWKFAPPPQAFQTPEMAAYNWTSAVHELQLQINGTRDYETTRNCLRALERCPTEADAYVVLARLYEGDPERALNFVESGLDATRRQEPEIAPGTSPWRSHLYRDVMRLHLIRAQSLLELGRTDEGFREFDQLLQIDPEDLMGAALWYVLALIEHSRYHDAQRIHAEYCAHTPPDATWTGALLAWAAGDRAEAKRLATEGLRENPWVVSALLGRRLETTEDPHDRFDAQDALFYAHRASSAWRHVEGAYAWLRRLEGTAPGR